MSPSKPGQLTKNQAKPIKAKQSRTKQKRGVETRNKIVDATVRLISREGVGAVTHRAVAREAGVSLSPTTYHFESKEMLLREAYGKLHASEMARYKNLVAQVADDSFDEDAMMDYVTALVIREATEFKEDVVAGFELLLEATRSAEFRDRVEETYMERFKFWRDLMAGSGSDDAESDGHLMVCSSIGSFLLMMASGFDQAELAKIRQKIKSTVDSLPKF